MQVDDARGSSPIHIYVTLAKQAKGKAAIDLIGKAIEEKGLFFFGELLDCPSIVELENIPEGKPYVDILKLFAYGTYTEYKQRASSLPALSPVAVHKLKQLSIMSAAAESKLLPYTTLMEMLEISSVRELEDLIIDDIYQGLLKGKMEQKTKQLQVYEAMSRDVKPGQIADMKAKLMEWFKVSEEMQGTIEEKISYASKAWEDQQAQAEQVEVQIEATKKTLKMESEIGTSGKLDSMDYGFDDPSASRPKSRFKTNHKMDSKQPERRR